MANQRKDGWFSGFIDGEMAPEWILYAGDGLSPGLSERDLAALLEAGEITAEPYCAANNRLTIKRGWKRDREPYLLRGTFFAKTTGRMIVGAGADYYFQYKVNGKICYDTLSLGNGGGGATAQDKVFFCEVEKGVNDVLVSIESGSRGMNFATGLFEPSEEHFRMISRRFILSGLFPGRARLVYGPWLSHPDNGRVSIHFETDGLMPAAVDYRVKGSAGWLRECDARNGHFRVVAEHAVHLDGLLENADYEYRIVLQVPENGEERILPEVYQFRSFGKERERIVFHTLSDTHVSSAAVVPMLNRFQENCDIKKGDFFLHLGDIYGCFENFSHEVLSSWMDFFRCRPGIPGIPFILAQGNHEYCGMDSDRWNAYFTSPQGKNYTAFRLGNTFFFILDASCTDHGSDSLARSMFSAGGVAKHQAEQIQWIEETAQSEACQSATFCVVAGHFGLYRVDVSRQEPVHDAAASIVRGGKCYPAVMKLLSPILKHRKIHLYLCGHSHHYLRSLPNQNTVYRRFDNNIRYFGLDSIPFTVLLHDGGENAASLNTSEVVIDQDRIRVRSMQADGTVFDTFDITPDGEVVNEITSLIKISIAGSRSWGVRKILRKRVASFFFRKNVLYYTSVTMHKPWSFT